MILKTEYIQNNKEVYVTLISEGLLGVGWFCIFDAKDFYNRYYASGEPGGAKRCHEDIIDTYCNNVGSLPYSKEELLKNTKLSINSMLMPYIKSEV
jgi:hypothetical protein